jgi:hypothetical protein
MKFQTEVKIESLNNKINYNYNLLFLGSCFSGNIGNKFSERLFKTLVNPFGVIFNPISIFKLIERAIDRKYFEEDDWIFRNERWLNLDLHSDLSNTDLNEAIHNSNNLIDFVAVFIKNTDYLFLTFGTAWIYEFKYDNKLVANCHKIPQKEFEKRILTVLEIIEYGEKIINKLKILNNKLQIVFTVSPVRHWADGAHNNNLSKSTLHLAINELLKIKDTHYFPSYELVIDQLRDYRFYDRDFVHPNKIATDFVWEKLSEYWIEETTQKEILETEKLIAAANHRPFNQKSEAHQKFIKNTLNKVKESEKKLSNLNFNEIKEKLTRQLR